MAKHRTIYRLLLSALVFAILYVYFLPFETRTIYGDDLYFYKVNSKLHTFTEWLNCVNHTKKYRPVVGAIDCVLMHLCDKNLHGYYVFSILVQTIITVVFAMIADLLLNATFFSFFISMLVGTSRFALYNVTQLFFGGPMEGVVMIFFLWTVYLLMKAFVHTGNTNRQNTRLLLLATAIANVAMYTHERYVVLLPFIVLVALFYPFRSKLTVKQKMMVSVIAVLSVAVNVLVKQYAIGIPFFVGTGRGEIFLSFTTALGFLSEGLLSIIQINTGGEMLVGNSFAISEGVFQVIAVTLVLCAAVVLVLYIGGLYKKSNSKTGQYASGYVILFLVMLLLLCMAPAISTTRLEQRWLQASFSIFILILVVALANIRTYPVAGRNVAFAAFVLLFILSDHNYLYKGAYKFFIMQSEQTANRLLAAVRNGLIRPEVHRLFIQEDWWLYSGFVSQDGYLFTFYGLPSKMVFILTDPHQDDKGYVVPIGDFVPGQCQVIYVRQDSITDITGRYLVSSNHK